MENTGELNTNRIYVEKFNAESYSYGARITLVKHDGSDFSDSEIDKIFWKAFEYSNNGPNATERDGTRMIIAIRNFEDAKEFANEIALREEGINITEKVNIVSSNNTTLDYNVTVSRRGNEQFSKAEINAIFQNALNCGSSLKRFEPSKNKKEVSVCFGRMGDWCEFIEQFMCEEVKAKMKKAQLPEKEAKRGFFKKLFSL